MAETSAGEANALPTPRPSGAAASAMESTWSEPTPAEQASGGRASVDVMPPVPPLSTRTSRASLGSLPSSRSSSITFQGPAPTPSPKPPLTSTNSGRKRVGEFFSSVTSPNGSNHKGGVPALASSVSEPPYSGRAPASVRLQHVKRFSDDEDDNTDDRDELDQSVDLEDDEQVLNKHNQTVRRNEKMAAFRRVHKTFRETLSAGIMVEVLEIVASDKPLSFVLAKMKLVDVNGTDHDIVKGRLSWEVDKPKPGLFGGLFGGRPAKAVEVPDTVLLSELYTNVRGFRKVRSSVELPGADNSRLVTLTTLQTPERSRRGLVLMFDKRESRNFFLDGLRKFLGDMQDQSPSPSEVSSSLKAQAITIKGYEKGQVMPFDEVVRIVVSERKEQNNLLGQIVELSEDVNALEKEYRDLLSRLKKLSADNDLKDEEILKGKQIAEDRLMLLKKVQDMEMDVANNLLINASMAAAIEAQHTEELKHARMQWEDAHRMSRDLLDKQVEVQRQNQEVKEESQRYQRSLAELGTQFQRQEKALKDSEDQIKTLERRLQQLQASPASRK